MTQCLDYQYSAIRNTIIWTTVSLLLLVVIETHLYQSRAIKLPKILLAIQKYNYTLRSPFFEIQLFSAIHLFVYCVILVYFSVYGFERQNDGNFPRFAYLALVQFAVAPVLALRNSPLTLFGFSYDKMIFWHILLSTIGVTFSIVHGSLYLSEWNQFGGISFFLDADPRYKYGLVAGSIVCGIFLFSNFLVRRYFFKTFKVIHLVSYPLLLVILYMHMNLCTTRFLLPAFILTIFDWLVRIFRLSTSTVVLQNEKIGSITKIVLKTDKKVYKPGQWFLLYVPPFDLHPFSVTTTSFNGQPALGFAVSSCGKFTRTISSIHTFRIDGPYGNSFDDILKHKKIILIAGGIGITPLLNIVDFAKKINLEDKSIGIEFIFVANSIKTLDAFEQELVEVKGVGNLMCFLTKSTLVSTDAGYDRPFPIETGRPDFVQLLSKQKNEHLSSIGVAVCGPKDMIISVREAARHCSSFSNQFTVYSEIFSR